MNDAHDNAIADKEMLRKAEAAVRASCEWTEDERGEFWSAACGKNWTFFEGGPVENGTKFCVNCGLPVVAVKYKPPEDNAEE